MTKRGEEVELLPCPQCGDDTPADQFDQGYCRACCDENQSALDAHNAAYDHWRGLSAKERETAIRGAMQ